MSDPFDPSDLRAPDWFDAAIEDVLEREFEENRETDRLAETLRGLPETRFGVVPDSVLPIFEFDEAQRAFQRMVYYSRFQEVS